MPAALGIHFTSIGLNIQSTLRLRNDVLAAFLRDPLAGIASIRNTFLNDQSLDEQLAAQGAQVRVVDLVSTDRLNVAYGDSHIPQWCDAVFVDLDALDRNSVDVNQLAPSGNAGKLLVVCAGRNPSNRR
ncbi:hypothetical protein C7444_10574 [Sphaerotilus hippei]|uniref:Uncharacterized protein n=1 Tax=Sphaerotilus hippei TaxID=744406 RepID=A0A318H9L7_9BURK|nr:hypothetical protein [Sphaerotilus hippei]PXW96977.1 hypothetical protein C7444_10574 [Sphaerotilus hippei]